MAFQSYDELIKMASTNPKQATELVRRAQQGSGPVVSADNPGYQEDPRQKALKRSMKNKTIPQDDLVQQRKNMEY
jgi:hypothetical protein